MGRSVGAYHRFPTLRKFPFERWGLKRLTVAVQLLLVGTMRPSDGGLLKVNYWCLKHLQMTSWCFFALWPGIVNVHAINHCTTCLGGVQPFVIVRFMVHQSKEHELMGQENLKSCPLHWANALSTEPPVNQCRDRVTSTFLCVTFWGRWGLGGKNAATWQLAYKLPAEG